MILGVRRLYTSGLCQREGNRNFLLYILALTELTRNSIPTAITPVERPTNTPSTMSDETDR